MGLLTQHDVERKLSEGIISESQPVRLYCTTQLQKMWGLIQSGLGISDDERSLLVRGCLNNLFEVCMYVCVCMYVYVYVGVAFAGSYMLYRNVI